MKLASFLILCLISFSIFADAPLDKAIERKTKQVIADAIIQTLVTETEEIAILKSSIEQYLLTHEGVDNIRLSMGNLLKIASNQATIHLKSVDYNCVENNCLIIRDDIVHIVSLKLDGYLLGYISAINTMKNKK